MRTILTLVRLHMAILARDRSTVIQGFAVPILLMVLLGLALGDDLANDADLLLDVVDQDQSALSADFIDTLETISNESDTVIVCVYGADDNPDACDLDNDADFADVGSERLEDLTTSAALIIPAGFADDVGAGTAVDLEYRSDSDFNNQTVTRTTVDSALGRFNASLSIATAGLSAVDTYFDGYDSDDARQADYDALLQRARVQLETTPAVVNKTSAEEEIIVGLGTRQSVSGQGAMFVLFSLLSLAAFMVEERNNGTLARLLVIPTPKINIVLGKILGVFLFGVMQFAIFVVVGILLGVDWGDDYIALAALIISFCLAGTALGFLISTFTTTAAQAGNAVTFFGLMLAPLGGAWWPLTIVPDFMKTIGHLSPIAWIMDGFQDLLYYEGTLVDVLPEVGVLLLFAAVFTAVGVMRFSYD